MKPAIGIGLMLAAASCGQGLVNAAEPKWDFDTNQPHVVEPVWVEVTVDRTGRPVAFVAETGVPEPLERALRGYQFQPANQPYLTGVTLQIHRTFAGYWARPMTTLGKQDASAQRQIEKLDPDRAAKMEAKLDNKPESARERTILVRWAAQHPGPEADAIRIRQIAWLVENAPRSDVLRDAASYVDSRDGSGGSEGYKQVRELWQKILQTRAASPAWLAAATRFFRVAEPEVAESLLKRVESQTYFATPELGRLYAWAGIGVSAASLTAEGPAAAGDLLPQSEFAVRARSALEGSTDARLLYGAMAALTEAGRSLGEAGEAPKGFAEFCGAVLRQTKQHLPDTEMTCEVAAKGAKPQMEGAKIRKQPKPSYPEAARQLRLEGRVVFMARIGTDGKVHDQELAIGAFVFADAAREPLSRWEYKPTVVNGKPVDVLTELEVNFDIR